jgi:hypothetical protein
MYGESLPFGQFEIKYADPFNGFAKSRRKLQMKGLFIGIFSMFLAGQLVSQQGSVSAQASEAPQKSISSRLGLHAFPARNQTREQQQTDELACYNWAQQDTGFDPIAAVAAAQSTKNSQSAQGSPSPGAPQGAGAKGAARGAAGGAAIGAIAGDPGKGAAIGAASGGLRGRMAQKRAQAEAQQRSQQQAQQQAQQQSQAKAQTQASLDDFKKAYSACMDAKGYSLK